MLTTIGNAPEGQLVTAPRRPDGGLYLWELVTADGRARAYADTVEELLDAVIPGHGGLGDGEARRAREQHAHAVRPYLQAEAAAGQDLAALDDGERAVLAGETSPDLAWWSQHFTLVLVDSDYAPEGTRPRPLTPDGDVHDPPTICWLRPATAEGYLMSLARAGWVSLHQHKGIAPA